LRLLLIFFLFIVGFAFSQTHKQYSPTVAEYEDKIDHVAKMAKGVFENKTWTEIILKNKYSEKELLWNELSEYQKDMFMFVVGNRTLSSIIKIEEYWQEEIKRFDNPNHKLITSSESRPATKKEVLVYLDKLEISRKNFVAELEKYNDVFFKKYKNELTNEEISSYMKKIKDSK